MVAKCQGRIPLGDRPVARGDRGVAFGYRAALRRERCAALGERPVLRRPGGFACPQRLIEIASGCVALGGDLVTLPPGAIALDRDLIDDMPQCVVLTRERLDATMMNDALGELVNMTAGVVKTAMDLDQTLGLPTILESEADTHRLVDRGWPPVVLKADGLGLLLWLCAGTL